MGKALVAYFSASGVTADAAGKVAKAAGASIYEIRPETPYSKEDLDWQNPDSRSSIEMKDKSYRPPIADKDAPVAESDVIYLGFPIWWYAAPTIINTFLESYDFSGKKIVLFATSGSSGLEKAVEDIKKSAGGAADVREGVVAHGIKDDWFWKEWVDSLGI